MAYWQCKPGAQLAPYVDAYWMVRRHAPGAVRILPDGCQDIIVEVHAPTECQLIGTLTRYVDAQYAAPVTLFGVRFKPAGLAAFIPIPQDQLSGQTVALRVIDPVLASSISQVNLADSAPLSRWVTTIETILQRRIATHALPDQRVVAAVKTITQTGGQGSVSGLASQVCLSERQLERHFLRSVGMAPKALMELVRFRALTQRLEEQPFISLTEAAFQAGYYDSAQLTRVFQRLAGELPSQYQHRRMSDLYKREGG